MHTDILLEIQSATKLIIDMNLKCVQSPIRAYSIICSYCLPDLEEDDKILFRYAYELLLTTPQISERMNLPESTIEEKKDHLLKNIKDKFTCLTIPSNIERG